MRRDLRYKVKWLKAFCCGFSKVFGFYASLKGRKMRRKEGKRVYTGSYFGRKSIL